MGIGACIVAPAVFFRRPLLAVPDNTLYTKSFSVVIEQVANVVARFTVAGVKGAHHDVDCSTHTVDAGRGSAYNRSAIISLNITDRRTKVV